MISSRNIFAMRMLWLCVLLFVSVLRPAFAEEEYLDPTDAFKFSASLQGGNTIAVNFRIAKGYYMYRERFKFAVSSGKIGEVKLPAGKLKFDETFQKEVESYRDLLQFSIPVEATGPITLTVTSQGCADAGLCYSPMESTAKFVIAAIGAPKATLGTTANASSPNKAGATLAAALQDANAVVKPSQSFPVGNQTKELPKAPVTSSASSNGAPNAASANGNTGPIVSAVPVPVITESPSTVATSSAPSIAASAAPTSSASSQGTGTEASTASGDGAKVDGDKSSNNDSDSRIANALASGKLHIILPIFWALGLALSLTPCVLPMVPILSFIIVGEGAMVSRRRGFVLSLAYVLGMSIIYTLLGVASGLAGEGLAAALQNPWVLGVFGVLMVALALAMFDVYQLQLPASLQTKLILTSEKQRRGKLFGVFLMGAISALIVGPCVTAPLVGTLVYISHTRDAVLGGLALFAMAIGMGTPLLLMGASAGQLLPKAGMWMDAVKKFFGVMLLGVALWLVGPVLPPALVMVGWSVLGIGYGVYLLRGTGAWVAKTIGVIVLILGAMELVGVASGGRDPLAPLAHLKGGAVAKEAHFKRIKTSADLDAALAANRGKVVMLDFYADWCVACIEMEKLTFPDAGVAKRMANMVLLQVDVTANDAHDKEMLKRFGLFGPPGIIFFDREGKELRKQRVIGYQNAERFTRSLDAAL